MIKPLDTHKAIKQLQETGMAENQAELFVKIVRDLTLSNLADKSDIQEINFKITNNAVAIDELKGVTDELKQGFTKLDNKVEQLDNKIQQLDSRMNAGFTQMEADFKRLDNDNKNIQISLASIKTEMVMLRRFIMVVGIAVLLAAIKYMFV